MKSSLELKDEKAQLKKQALDILEGCKKEIRDLNSNESEEYKNIKEKIENINEELRKLNKEFNVEKNNNILKDKKMDKKMDFSLIKAIRNAANNVAQDNLSKAVIEAGASEMRKAGLNYVGQIQLPTESRAAVTVTSEGEDVVATDMFDVVKPLQAKNVMIQAGAKYITGLVGDLQYPIMSNANVTWEGETAAAKDGAPTFDNVKLQPKRLTAIVPISKQFIIQDSVGAENAIREEIVNAINAKIEATILGAGAGSATEPKGMFPSEGDSTLTAVTDFSKVCDLEAELEDANVNGEMKYLVSPKAKAALRGMAKGTKSTQLVYENGEVDGTTALCTSHLKNKHIVYGDFSQYIIAQWGNIDIVVDNVTLAGNGQIRLVVNCYFDMKPLREEAFKVAKVGA